MMRSRRRLLGGFAGVAAVAMLGGAGFAVADGKNDPAPAKKAPAKTSPAKHHLADHWRFAGPDHMAELAPVPHDPAADNGSEVSGAVFLDQRGRKLRITLVATGLDAMPHAMHIHARGAGMPAMCPGADRRDDLVDDGLIETSEGIDDYGSIKVSLTTTGDTSPESALSLDRFPIASAGGVLTYTRTVILPKDIAMRLDDAHIVLHGEDLDGNGEYGGRMTALGAPLEAELPVACGTIDRVEKD